MPITFGPKRNIAQGSPCELSVCSVTGTLSPDATGLYFKTDDWAEHSCYRRNDNSWYIWWNQYNSTWYISAEAGSAGQYQWTSEDMANTEYAPAGDSFGTATVTKVK